MFETGAYQLLKKKTVPSYEIDPAELHRVYPPSSSEQAKDRSGEQFATHDGTNENRALQTEVQGLREQLTLLKNERDDLRHRLDAESEERRRLTYLLTDTQPTAAPASSSGWWTRLFR